MTELSFDIAQDHPADLNIGKRTCHCSIVTVSVERRKKTKAMREENNSRHSVPGFVSIIVSHLLFFLIYNDPLDAAAAAAAAVGGCMHPTNQSCCSPTVLIDTPALLFSSLAHRLDFTVKKWLLMGLPDFPPARSGRRPS
jgi:hypothetical protein